MGALPPVRVSHRIVPGSVGSCHFPLQSRFKQRLGSSNGDRSRGVRFLETRRRVSAADVVATRQGAISRSSLPISPKRRTFTRLVRVNWRTFDALMGKEFDEFEFTHWMQLEPDVTPIRRGWVDEILRLAQLNVNCSDWWQLGSLPLGDDIRSEFIIRNRAVPDHHLNGNSLYCLRSSEYDEYRRRVREAYSPMACHAQTDEGHVGGFDTASYVYRADPARYRESRFVEHKFRAAPFVLNY